MAILPQSVADISFPQYGQRPCGAFPMHVLPSQAFHTSHNGVRLTKTLLICDVGGCPCGACSSLGGLHGVSLSRSPFQVRPAACKKHCSMMGLCTRLGRLHSSCVLRCWQEITSVCTVHMTCHGLVGRDRTVLQELSLLLFCIFMQ